MPNPGEVTLLLAKVRDGNRDAADQLIPLIYQELRRTADHLMRRERPDHTLQATVLVNEAYMRLVGQGEWQSRAHFFATAANSMRQILIDYARRHHRKKRGGDSVRKVEIEEHLVIAEDNLEDVLAVDEALNRLAQIDPRQSRIVELRYFAGLNVDETAEVMGVSPKTVKRDWRSAKAWLYREMTSARGV